VRLLRRSVPRNCRSTWNVLVGAAKNGAVIATAEGVRVPSDRDVVLSSHGRPECFEAIFDRHATTIYRYLRRRAGAALAEDLVAETFARAFHARCRFDPRGESALPWLYGIAANLLRMHRRAEERRLRAYARAAEHGVEPSPSADSDRRLDAVALRPALAEALASLPLGQRQVLLLHAWTGLSHEGIAAALEISATTVRSRLHRARVHVAERLARSGNETDDDPMVAQR
jgi:RNA polymerase sigma factor (sigma-70 family)